MKNNLPLELIDFIHEKISRKKLSEITISGNNFLYILDKKRIKKYWNKSGLYKLIKYNDISGVKYLSKSRDNIENTNENVSIEKKKKLVEKICENKQLEMIQIITNISCFSIFNDIFNTFRIATNNGYLELAYWVVKDLGKDSNPDWMEKICDSAISKLGKNADVGYNENFQSIQSEKIKSENRDIFTYKFTVNGWPENIWITGEDYHTWSHVKNFIEKIDKVYIVGDQGTILHFWPGDYLLSVCMEENNRINLPLFPWNISTEKTVIIIEARIPFFMEILTRDPPGEISNPFQMQVSKIHTVNNTYDLLENYRKQKIEPNLYPIYLLSDITPKFYGTPQYTHCEFDWIVGPNVITEIIFMKPWPKSIRFRFDDFPIHFSNDNIDMKKLIEKNNALIFSVIIFPNCRYTMNLEYPQDISTKGNIYTKYVNCLISRESHIFSEIYVTR